MRAVENPDAPARRDALRHAPQERVVELIGGRCLEGMHLAADRVHAVQHMLDDAAFARRIHALQDHQHGPLVLRVEPLLQPGEILRPFRDLLLAFLLADLEPAGVARIEIRELERLRPVDPEALDELAAIHEHIPSQA